MRFDSQAEKQLFTLNIHNPVKYIKIVPTSDNSFFFYCTETVLKEVKESSRK